MKADPNVPNNVCYNELYSIHFHLSTQEGETPVMIARALGEGEIEKVLLENGANSDMVSPS